MATKFKLLLRQDTVPVGPPLVIQLGGQSLPNELQLVCVAGDPIEIIGVPGTILGLPTTPLLLYPTQFFRFNEEQYTDVTITIPVGTIYELIANA